MTDCMSHCHPIAISNSMIQGSVAVSIRNNQFLAFCALFMYICSQAAPFADVSPLCMLSLAWLLYLGWSVKLSRNTWSTFSRRQWKMLQVIMHVIVLYCNCSDDVILINVLCILHLI